MKLEKIEQSREERMGALRERERWAEQSRRVREFRARARRVDHGGTGSVWALLSGAAAGCLIWGGAGLAVSGGELGWGMAGLGLAGLAVSAGVFLRGRF